MGEKITVKHFQWSRHAFAHVHQVYNVAWFMKVVLYPIKGSQRFKLCVQRNHDGAMSRIISRPNRRDFHAKIVTGCSLRTVAPTNRSHDLCTPALLFDTARSPNFYLDDGDTMSALKCYWLRFAAPYTCHRGEDGTACAV